MRTIICYGDSNTYGYDPRSFIGERYSEKERWTGILDEAFDDNVLNYGMNGRCIPHTKNQINTFLELIRAFSEKPDEIAGLKYEDVHINRNESEHTKNAMLEVWIMLGTNDLLQNPNMGARGIAERMRHFLSALFREEAVRSKKIQIKLLVPARMKRGSWVETDNLVAESERIGDYYEKIADEFGISCIRTDRVEIPVLFDGVHFSEEGHRNLADYLLSLSQSKKTSASISGEQSEILLSECLVHEKTEEKS